MGEILGQRSPELRCRCFACTWRGVGEGQWNEMELVRHFSYTLRRICEYLKSSEH